MLIPQRRMNPVPHYRTAEDDAPETPRLARLSDVRRANDTSDPP